MLKLVSRLSLLACLALVHLDQANGCNVKNFGSDSITCICSETLQCEGELNFLNEIVPDEGAVTSYLTGKSGPRYERSVFHFTSEAAATGEQDLEVTVDRTKRHQTIMGFGGAFTDATGYNIARLPAELQKQLIEDYFGPNGIEYSIGRVTIGGSDFSTRAYSNDDNPTDESLSTFALQPEDLNYKLPYIAMAKAKSRHGVTLFGSAWSAPAWMKTNHELNHGGFLRGEPGGPYYKAFAKYHVKFLEEYTKHNATLWGLTVVNEPGDKDARPDFRYNSLSFPNIQAQRDYVAKDLGPELHAAGFDKVAVMIHDFNIDNIERAANAFYDDPESDKYVAGAALHWYGRSNKEGAYDVLQKIQDKYPTKFILSTEACFDFLMPQSLGDWWRFNEVATDIIKVLNQGVIGWVDWNMVLDLNGGPTWVNDAEHPWHLDSPIHVSDDGKEYYKLPTFYALGHFSKFVVPNSVRLSFDAKHDDNLLALLAERPDKSLVLTVLNKNGHKVAVQVHDPSRGYLNVTVDSDSLQSLIWN